jgi:hypothetical protein
MKCGNKGARAYFANRILVSASSIPFLLMNIVYSIRTFFVSIISGEVHTLKKEKLIGYWQNE